MRRIAIFILLGLSLGAGAALGFRLWAARRPPLPDPPALVERVREVARLEALDVSLWKKVTFEPEPVPAGSLWGDVGAWARRALRPPRGRAIVFADAHLGFDLSRLGTQSLRTEGREVSLVLPPLQIRVEIRPGDTEIIGSNLDSAETAQLLELARAAFQRQVESDRALRERALTSARRSLTALLLSLGFERVHFVDALPAREGS